MLWCQPNSKFLKIAILYKIIKSGNLLFGWHQVLETGSQQQQEPPVGVHRFIEAKWTFLVKLVIFAQQDAIEGDQAQQQ